MVKPDILSTLFSRVSALSGRWPGLFGVVEATNTSFFFGAGRPVGAWLGLTLVLNFEDLCTDSFVCHAASNQFIEGQVSKNTLYSSAMS